MSIDDQLRTFYEAVRHECRHLYAILQTFMEERTFSPPLMPASLELPSADVINQAADDAVIAACFGGFDLHSGAIMEWNVRDAGCMAMHVMTLRLRAGQGRAVWCSSDLAWAPSDPPKTTLQAAYSEPITAALRAVRSFDIQAIAAWDMAARNLGLLPIDSVETVMGYFRANSVPAIGTANTA